MAFKCLWSVWFVTIFYSIIYTNSSEDIKQLTFRITQGWLSQAKGIGYKCNSDHLDTKVGERFQIMVSHYTKVITNWCGNAYYLNSTINRNNGKLNIIISFTKPGDWKYKCGFQINGKDFICSATVRVKKDVEPHGYLMVNTLNISSSEEEYIYKFHAGDSVNFTCFKINGNALSLKVTRQDRNIMSSLSKNALIKIMNLTVADNNTSVECNISGDKTYKLIKLRLMHSEDTQDAWIIVSSSILVLVLIASGLWMLFRYKIRKRTRKNSPSIVYYQNLPRRQNSSAAISLRDRPDDLDTEFVFLRNPNNSQKNTVKELTYLNSQYINNDSSVNDNEADHIVAYKSQPNYVKVESNLQKIKKDATVKQNAAYINQNNIKPNKFDKLNTKKPKVSKHRKETLKLRPAITREPDIIYADLALGNTNSRSFVPSKMSNYSDIRVIQVKNCQYENANVKNDLEPAYCEIIPTKTKF